jgi:hypothetical protein
MKFRHVTWLSLGNAKNNFDTPRERAPGNHWIGGWVGPRAVLDAVV